MTRETSREAYLAIQENGVLEHREWQVYQMLFHNGPMTQNEVWTELAKDEPKLPKQSVSPRFAQLVRRSAIHSIETRPCKVTGFKCLAWDVTRNLPRPLEKQESELVRLRRENCELKKINNVLQLRLSKWGRPKDSEKVVKNCGLFTNLCLNT